MKKVEVCFSLRTDSFFPNWPPAVRKRRNIAQAARAVLVAQVENKTLERLIYNILERITNEFSLKKVIFPH